MDRQPVRSGAAFPWSSASHAAWAACRLWHPRASCTAAPNTPSTAPPRWPDALKEMPDRWRACLGGNGEIDLRGVECARREGRLSHVGDDTVEVDGLRSRCPLSGTPADPPARRPGSSRRRCCRIPWSATGHSVAAHRTRHLHDPRPCLCACCRSGKHDPRPAGRLLPCRDAASAIAANHRPAAPKAPAYTPTGCRAHKTPSRSLTVTSHGSLLSVGGTVCRRRRESRRGRTDRLGEGLAPASASRHRRRQRPARHLRCRTGRTRVGGHPESTGRVRRAPRQLPAVPPRQAEPRTTPRRPRVGGVGQPRTGKGQLVGRLEQPPVAYATSPYARSPC